MLTHGCGSKPSTPGGHQNRWQLDVHPPHGAICPMAMTGFPPGMTQSYANVTPRASLGEKPCVVHSRQSHWKRVPVIKRCDHHFRSSHVFGRTMVMPSSSHAAAACCLHWLQAIFLMSLDAGSQVWGDKSLADSFGS